MRKIETLKQSRFILRLHIWSVSACKFSRKQDFHYLIHFLTLYEEAHSVNYNMKHVFFYCTQTDMIAYDPLVKMISYKFAYALAQMIKP